MANQYFNNIRNLLAGATARGDQVDDKFDAVSLGFDQAEADHKKLVQIADSSTPQVITATPLNRQDTAIGFDDNGDLTLHPNANTAATAASVSEVNAATSSASSTVSAAAALASEQAALGSANNAATSAAAISGSEANSAASAASASNDAASAAASQAAATASEGNAGSSSSASQLAEANSTASATSSATSAAASLASEQAALGSANNAVTSAAAAGGSETNAATSAAAALTSEQAAAASAVGLTTHAADTANPHAVTAAQVGLGLVDNTSDLNKPVSTAQAAALVAQDGGTMLADPAVALGVATKGYVDAVAATPIADASVTYSKLEQHIAGDIAVGEPLDISNTALNVWQASPAYTLLRGGVVRMNMRLTVSGTQPGGFSQSTTIYGQVYVNGVAVGSQRLVTSLDNVAAIGVWDEDIAIQAGDFITLQTFITTNYGLAQVVGMLGTLTFKIGNRITL